MKILFFISTVKGRNSGNGGHYRSLLSYYEQLKIVADEVALMHYNEKENSILDGKMNNLLKGVADTNTFRKKANEILKNGSWNTVISFGEGLQSRLLRYYCWKYKMKFIQVVAGGPNRFLPMNFVNCIYYSSENIENPRDFTPNKFLLTNRIDKFSTSPELIGELEQKYPKKEYNLLRVSRICYAYLETFISAINLHALLLEEGIDIQTHLVGHIQEVGAYEELTERIKGLNNIYIITENRFTNDVKKLMSYYNFAIGIGRGFGEAASKNLTVLGYSSISKLPIIINEENYKILRDSNFSPRAHVDEKFAISNYMQLFSLCSKVREEYKKFTNLKFEEDYSSSKLQEKLKVIIEKSKEENLFSILLSLLFISLSEIGHRLDYFFEKRGYKLDIKKRFFLK